MTFTFDVPTPTGSQHFAVSAGSSPIFVGANGGGKTRLAVQIEKLNLANVHRISAHRSLALNPAAPKISERLAKNGLKFGYAHEDSGVGHKSGQRWGNEKWATHLLADFDFVIQGLFAEQSNTAVKRRPKGTPDRRPKGTPLAEGVGRSSGALFALVAA